MGILESGGALKFSLDLEIHIAIEAVECIALQYCISNELLRISSFFELRRLSISRGHFGQVFDDSAHLTSVVKPLAVILNSSDISITCQVIIPANTVTLGSVSYIVLRQAKLLIRLIMPWTLQQIVWRHSHSAPAMVQTITRLPFLLLVHIIDVELLVLLMLLH
jgi:hypothetical protein